MSRQRFLSQTTSSGSRARQRTHRVFKSYDDILDSCCFAWNMRIDLVGTVANIDSPKIRRNLKKRLADCWRPGKNILASSK